MNPMTSSDDIVHTYAPLPGPGFIRLMHVEPALHADTPLRFSFQIAELARVVAKYEAVSYTWGRPILKHPLYIDDRTYVSVTQNLDKALRRLRHPATTRVLLADAVCINQVDSDEKSTQIPLMARIFRGASTVLAWLDDGAEEERGMVILERLSRYGMSENEGERIADRRLRMNGSHTSEDNVLIHKFLNLAWFTRLWIIQEIVMNADVVLFCGMSSMTWTRFPVALSNYRYIQTPATRLVDQHKLDALETITKVWAQHNLTDRSQTGTRGGQPAEQESIFDLVETFSGYGCADPRDQIFALYSMTQDIQSSNYVGDLRCVRMDVDYSSSIRQIYQQFASACIPRSKPVLDAVLARQYSPRCENLPSWVPDWRKPPSKNLYWPSIGNFPCLQVAHDILRVSLAQASRFEYHEGFYLVHQIFTSPDTIDGSMKLLFTLCRERAHLTLSDTLRVLLPHGSEEERRVFGKHIAMICEGQLPPYITSTTISQMSLDLHATMQHHRFFSATITTRKIGYTNEYADSVIFGYGNAALAKGDKVVELYPRSKQTSIHRRQHNDALLLRQSPSRTGIEGYGIVTHKLIGSAIIMDLGELDFSHNSIERRVYLD
jgi:hypothetical protein